MTELGASSNSLRDVKWIGFILGFYQECNVKERSLIQDLNSRNLVRDICIIVLCCVVIYASE